MKYLSRFPLIIILALNITTTSYTQLYDDTITIIFSDKTTSTKNSSFIQLKNKKWLNRILGKSTSQNNATIITSYLYSQTAIASNVHTFRYQEPTSIGSPKNALEDKMESLKLKRRKRTYKKGFFSKVEQMVFSDKKDHIGSNIIGSIKQMHDLSKAYPSSSLDVYFFSDMIEHSDFRKMASDSLLFSSYLEAELQAEKDYEKIQKKYLLGQKPLKAIRGITVILPTDELDKNALFEYAPIYWQKLFGLLGVPHIVFL